MLAFITEQICDYDPAETAIAKVYDPTSGKWRNTGPALAELFDEPGVFAVPLDDFDASVDIHEAMLATWALPAFCVGAKFWTLVQTYKGSVVAAGRIDETANGSLLECQGMYTGIRYVVLESPSLPGQIIGFLPTSAINPLSENDYRRACTDPKFIGNAPALATLEHLNTLRLTSAVGEQTLLRKGKRPALS